MTRAAVVEETAFRGYGLERLRELTGSKFLAAVMTWFLFTAVHLTSWGWGQVIIAAFGGLILTLLYVWRANPSSSVSSATGEVSTAFLISVRLTIREDSARLFRDNDWQPTAYSETPSV